MSKDIEIRLVALELRVREMFDEMETYRLRHDDTMRALSEMIEMFTNLSTGAYEEKRKGYRGSEDNDMESVAQRWRGKGKDRNK